MDKSGRAGHFLTLSSAGWTAALIITYCIADGGAPRAHGVCIFIWWCLTWHLASGQWVRRRAVFCERCSGKNRRGRGATAWKASGMMAAGCARRSARQARLGRLRAGVARSPSLASRRLNAAFSVSRACAWANHRWRGTAPSTSGTFIGDDLSRYRATLAVMVMKSAAYR